MANPYPKSGYAYALKHSDAARSGSWSSSSNNDDWDVVMFTLRHTSHYMWVGRRRIDGSEVNVWDDAQGRRYIAQTTVMTGRQLLENQGGATPWVVGLLALAGLAWWITSSKEAKAAPATTTSTCPITESMLAPYVKTKPTTYKLTPPRIRAGSTTKKSSRS